MFTSFALVCALVLGVQETDVTFAALELSSASGLFRAQIGKAPGQERVADALARWRLRVFSNDSEASAEPLWSSLFQHRAGERLHLLSDDGQSLLIVEPIYSASRALVRAWGPDGERFSLGAAELDLALRRSAQEQPPWLSAEGEAVVLEWHETPRGPIQFARLAVLDGAKRWIDLRSGEVRSSPRFESSIAVLPDAALAGVNVLAPPFVTSVECAARLHWGETLEVAIAGSHPTPNWRNVGFQFTLEGEDARTLTLLPMSSPPPANSPQLQVLQGYHATAQVFGLAPGKYTLRVRGRGEEQPADKAIEVLPARAALEMRTSGGILGMDRRVRIYLGGVAIVESTRPARERRITVMPPRSVARIEDLLRAAEGQSVATSTAVSDGLQHELLWRVGERDVRRMVFDPGASGAFAELIRMLAELHS